MVVSVEIKRDEQNMFSCQVFVLCPHLPDLKGNLSENTEAETTRAAFPLHQEEVQNCIER